jgi:type IV secretory pathway component VirB8
MLKHKKVKNISAKELENIENQIQEEEDMFGINFGEVNLQTKLKMTINHQRTVIFGLIVAIVFLASGYHYMLPLKTVEYLTVGYEIKDKKLETVKVMPATELVKNQEMLKLLVKYFIEETVQYALTHFKDEKLIKKYMSIVQKRTDRPVFNQILAIQRQLSGQEEIVQREIEIIDSEADGFGIWEISFITKDTTNEGIIMETPFKAKITYELYGFNDVEKMNVPTEMLKKNQNPLGLKIVGFHRIQTEQK